MDSLDCSIASITSQHKIVDILSEYERILEKRSYHHLGYPYNLGNDFEQLHKLVDFSINNLGDPFIPSNYGVHSRPFEVAVLDWFADLWNIPRDQYWGYVTSCGTEGNMHGIWLGRENMRNSAILIGSKACHYSVWKAGRMFAMEMRQIETQPNDELCYADLENTLKQLKAENPASTVVMVVNIGSTVRGAVDDISQVAAAFAAAGFAPNRDYFLHLDSALFGMLMPYIAPGQLTFANPCISSISVSGHKFIGSPVPCGIVLTRKPYIDVLSQNIAYINSRDATILGSRNGHAPLFLWYAIVQKGASGFQADANQCMANAQYMADRLIAAQIPKVMLNLLSCTVVFARPTNEEFISKWQLACQGDIAHVVVMPNVHKEKIDDFIFELIILGNAPH